MTEDETVGWHHQLDGHGFGWTPGVGDGQGGLVCCSSWGRKESYTTERPNWQHIFFPSLSLYKTAPNGMGCFLFSSIYLVIGQNAWILLSIQPMCE